MNRAPLSQDLQKLKNELPDLLGILEQKPDWYASVFFERRAGKSFSVNLKQTQVSDVSTQGVVLRIYDGFTLFEQATDQTNSKELEEQAKALVKRVLDAQIQNKNLTSRYYQSPPWTARLSQKLDPEITSQIPKDVSAKTWVHFGIPFQKDPTILSHEDRFQNLQSLMSRCKKLAPQKGLKESDLTYILFREGLAVEESLFIDRESRLSQTLYRVSMTVMMMSGSDRVAERIGGLGGREAIDVSDKQLLHMLDDVVALKKAERLNPGRYTLLMSPTLSGVLAHEAFGHSQEGDTCARGRSKAWELHKTGEKVGNSQATIYNNPAVYKNGAESAAAWGSYFFDEEGWLAQSQVILDGGVLKSPMTNLTSAIRLNVPRSANGKRESWQNGVYTRQTNTYFEPGTNTLDELLAMIDDGFVATNAAGGMEDPKGMGIQVGIQYLREVKNGKYTGKVFKGPSGGDIQLTGYVPDVLNSIVAKSKIEFEKTTPDEAKHPFNDCGGCGKYHKEIVYAGCGGPYMLLKDVILG